MDRTQKVLRFDIVSDAHKPYLPFERDSAMDCRRNRSIDNPIRCFLAGDYRANEQVTLHLLFPVLSALTTIYAG